MPEFEILTYGSYINGFETKVSDVDLTINTDSYVDERHMLKILHEHLVFTGINKTQLQLIIKESIRVPLLKYTGNSSTGKKVDIEITINNKLGYINSFLLKSYASFDPKIS